MARKAAKGSASLSKKACNGSRCGMQPEAFPYLRQARQGLWITLDAEIAKPSGWLDALGVGNPDSIAALAGAPTLRMAELTDDRVDDTSSDDLLCGFARAPQVNRMTG